MSAARGVCVAAALLAAAAAAGCGFHLAGREPLPRALAAVRIEDPDTQSDFYFALRADLESSGARLVHGADASAAVIDVLADQSSERVLSVSASNAPNEYELTYAVTVAVSVHGRQLMAPERHRLMRDYSFSESELLAKRRERAILRQALARELADIVMRRLSSL